MNRYERVQQILEAAVSTVTYYGPHGAFWRDLSRDEFVAHRVLGSFPLVELGDPDSSNLVLALEGRSPFGNDLPAPTPGAFLRRMPGGLPAAAPSDIAYIRLWIADGCPDEDDVAEAAATPEAAARPPQEHNDFWREFDDWALFAAEPRVREAVGVWFAAFPAYMDFVTGRRTLTEWKSASGSAAALAAVEVLAAGHITLAHKHYGDPLDEIALGESYELFGRGALPPDPQRPGRPDHEMDGASMWFIWAAFIDACVRHDVRANAIVALGRGVLVGLMMDGVFRGRFRVNGFAATPAGGTEIRNHVASLVTASEVIEELRVRFHESGLAT